MRGLQGTVLLVSSMGILLRLAVMPFTLHSDLVFIYQYPALFHLEGVWNIYEYIQTYYQDSVALHGWNYYPPATYLLIVLWQFVIQGFSSTFLPFMEKAFLFASTGRTVAEFLLFAQNQGLFRDLMLMKFPYLVFDIAAGSLLVAMLKTDAKIKGVLYWFLNPFLIYAPYMFGQMDVMPAALTFFGFALLFAEKIPHARVWAFVLFGVASGFKLYPVLFVPLLILLLGKAWRERAKLLFAFASMPVLLTVLFYSSQVSPVSIWFPSFAFRSIDQTIAALIKQIIFVILYAALLFISWRRSGEYSQKTVVGVVLTLILGVYSLTQYRSLHYLVWMIPFLPLWFRDVNRAYLLSWILFLLLIGFRIMARQHQLGLFIPLDPAYFSSLPSLAEIIGQVIPYQWVSDTTYILYHGILLGMTSWILWSLLRSKTKQLEV